MASSFMSKISGAVSGAVTDLVRKATSSGSPYDVQELSPQQFARSTVISRDGFFTLYHDKNVFSAVLYNPAYSKAYSLFQVMSETEATTTFSNMSFKLGPLVSSSRRMMNRETLQRCSDTLRGTPTWSCAHLAAKLSLLESIRHPLVKKFLDSVDEMSQVTPIMVAVETGNLECIQEFIISGVTLGLADNKGDNIFHHAAKTGDPTVIQYLASKDKSAINQLNLEGESALHTACLSNKPDNVEQLLRWGADPGLTMSGRYPIHLAMKASGSKCVEVLVRWSRDQLYVKDSQFGGSPLHWAEDKECVYALCDLGCNLEMVNNAGETALLSMVQNNRMDCVMALLTKGANAAAPCRQGNNALHMAVLIDNVNMVQALIVFGADINQINEMNQSPRHLAATCNAQNSDQILYLLHRVGAERCPLGVQGCKVGCMAGSTFDGTPIGAVISTPEHQKRFYDTMVTDVAMAAAMTRTASASGSSIMCETVENSIGSAGDRVLCLDGGGIRGLILIQLLLAIEKAVKQPIRNCFDWIAGSSTGGILALAIVHGKSVRYAQGLYFRLKSEVFCGRRPYASEPLERFMKKEFGEHTRMSEKDYPRVLVTGVLGDRCPPELHIFRNYDPPGQEVKQAMSANQEMFEPTPSPHEQKVWSAARSSGAAPTYFRAFGRFLDGGLIANNPTLDMMTEIHEYHMGLNLTGQGELVRPIHVLVSLGTGRPPIKRVQACDVYRPEGIMDIYKVVSGAKNLGQLMVEQITQSEGRPVDRARAWCSMIGVPYFRLSPQLSEDISLDCHEDKTLVHMLWETQCYIHDHWDKILKLATLLSP